VENWDEVRTAYQVARRGTVSGAAEALGVHHATVIRHVDALEARLGLKLFQRHARGYTPTEAGEDLLRVAQATEDQFAQLLARIKGSGQAVSGELVVTSLTPLGPQLTPLLATFQAQHPEVTIRFLIGERLFRLEYGEAHVAIRAGAKPEHPDCVVQALSVREYGMYAARSYVAAHGTPEREADYAAHRFVGPDSEDHGAPSSRWMAAHVPRDRVTWRSDDTAVLEAAVRAGVGIGLINAGRAREDAELIELAAPRPEWSAPLWLVTHVDLHRTTKVQALVQFLKEHVPEELA
jgi:DNA-binding transcriptional LysR family regulator